MDDNALNKTAAKQAELQTLHNKKAMLEALKATLGIVSRAAEKIGISRKTHYDWYKSDTEYAEAVDGINEHALDFAESKLHERIDGVTCAKYNKKGEEEIYELPPDVGAICFYLKCKGKKRGYIERQEITGAGGKDLIPAKYNLSALSTAELMTLKALQDKIEIKEP